MSKLSRNEFRELLTEWKSNFIVEKTIRDFGKYTKMTPEQEKFVKSVPVNLNLYAIGDYNIKNIPNSPISYYLVEAMKKSKFLFKKTHNGVILEKACIPELLQVLEYILHQSDFSYENRVGDNIKDKEDIEEKLSYNINQMKKDLNSLKSDKHGIMLYFSRMDSFQEDMADGSINKIGNVLDPAVWKNSLSWELKHDVFHYFESILEKENSKSYEFLNTALRNKNIFKIISNYRVPDQKLKSKDPSIRFGSSLGDGDNFATVIPYIRSLKNNEANKKYFVDECIKISDMFGFNLSEEEKLTLNKFFEKAHLCYEEVERILKEKIIIQRSHG